MQQFWESSVLKHLPLYLVRSLIMMTPCLLPPDRSETPAADFLGLDPDEIEPVIMKVDL